MKYFQNKCFWLLFIVFGGIHSVMAQSSEGTDFWLTFMDNIDTTRRGQALSIFATSHVPCSATISNPNTGWSQTFSVYPNSQNRIYVPLNQAYTTLSGQITNTGLHVVSTDTISLYSITEGYPNIDYANILPTNMLGSDYIIQTFPTDRYSSEFAIVAAEDDVTVSISLRGNTVDNHYSGQLYSIHIPHAGQVCQIRSQSPGDLSGTRLTVSDGKRVAVFNGDACAYIPNYNTRPSCDHVVEQATPTNCWGQRFIVPPSNLTLCDYVRITSLNDNCSVSLNGSVVATLSRSQTYQYTMASTTVPDYIETSQPVVVYLYFASYNGIGLGDPSMTTITPLEQSFTSITFPVLTSLNISQHAINVVCRSEAVPSIMLDGASMASSFVTVASAPGYSILHYPLTQGSHSLVDTSASGFVAFLYGAGNRVSYGYSLGFAGHILQPNFDLMVNGTRAVNYPHGYDICEGDEVVFHVVSDMTPDSILWSFGDGSFSYSNPVNHVFNRDDDYSVCAYIYYSDTTSPLLIDTICTTIHVKPSYFRFYHDTCVENRLPIVFGGHRYTGDVENDTIIMQTVSGCDSISVYSLKVWYNDSTYLDTLVCDTLLPYIWRGIEFTYDSVVIQRLFTKHGADSIVTLFFETYPCRPIPIEPEPKVDSVAIWVPNVFTPDITGCNDLFQIFCSDAITKARVSIYHRWGNAVTTFDGLNESWDGKMNGVPCEQGTYVYKIVYSSNKVPQGVQVMVGTVTLIR